MNKIFKVIWSKSKQCYIVVSEIAKNKTGKKKIVVASILAALAMAGNMQSVDATIPEGNATGNDAFAIGPQSNVNGAFGFAIGNNAKFNSGTLGFAIGVNSEATSNQSIAIGYQSKAAGRNIGGGGDPALAVGAGAKATAGGATAIGMVANASNTFATAIGKSAAASGDSSIAIGQNTTATQADTVAIGSSATAAALNSIAMGKNATITAPTSGTTLGGQDSIAVGTRSSANQHSSVSIGLEAKSDGVRSIAIGPKASATDEDTIAIGSGGIGADKNNQAAGANGSSFNTSVAGLAVTNLYYGAKSTGKQSIAIGYTANAKESGIAFGNNAVSDGGGGTAMGKSVLSRNGGVVVGQSSYATGKNSVSYGNTAQASGETSIAVGYSTTAAGQNAVAVGYSISAAGKNSVSIGSTNQAKNEGSIAIGRNNNANQNNTVVIGRDSNALGNQSIAMGANATSKGTNDVAIGNEVTADGDNSVAIGRSATTKSTASLAIGSYGTKGTSATGAFSIAMGRDVTASAESAIAIGKDAISDKKNAVAIGSGADTSTAATAQSSTNIAGKSYSWSKGVLSGADLAGMQVSVGKSGAERQIKNVAAGEVSANSTDAINGSQLYAVASGLAKDLKVPYVSINSTASGTGSNVDNDGAKGSNSIAIGPSSTVTRQNGIAIGSGAQSLSEDSVVIGRDAKAETKTGAGLTTTSRAIVIGSNSRVAADVTQGVAIGSGLSPDEGAVVTGDQSIAIGGNVKVDGHSAIAIGGDDARKAANQLVSYTNKNDAEVTGTLQTAISDLTGYNLNDYKGTTASHAGVAYGASALAGNAGVAIGTAADSMTRKNDKGQVVNNKPVTNAVAIGTGARANFDNSVAIGGGSNTDRYATKQVNAIIDGVEVKWSGGENISPGDVVSFGAKGFERQLKNVAPGEVSQTSTDAINGSQIYSLARKVTNIMNGGAGSLVNVNASGEPLTKVVTGTGANKQEKYYLTADVKDDGSLQPGAVAQTPKSLALVNVDEPNINQQTQTPRTLGNVANGVKDNDAVNVSQLKAATVKYFSVNSTDSGNRDNTGATGTNAIAIGPTAKSTGDNALAIGNNAQANSPYAVSLGHYANNGSTNSTNSVSIGFVAGGGSNGAGNVAIGSNAGKQVTGNNNISLGNTAGTVLNNNVYTSESILLGTGARVTGSTSSKSINSVIAIGKGAEGSATSATALGINANASAENAMALGPSSKATAYNGVALGSFSEANTAGGTAGYNANTSRTDKYAGLAGLALTANTGAVSIGSSTKTRQITNLAAGTNDTDAVNVAQLKSVNLAVKGNSGAGGDVNLATNPLTIKGNDNYITTSASGNTVNISGKVQNISVSNGTATAAVGMADAKNVAEAINNAVSQNAYTWNLTADSDTAGSRSTITKEGTVKFSGDQNITVKRNGNTITSSLNKSITVDSVKANNSVTTGSGSNQITLDGTTGAVAGKTFSGQSFTAGDNVLSNTTLQIGSPTNGNNVTITKDGLTSKAGTKTAKFGANGIDAGGQQIMNVSSGGNVGTNAANITDVKNAVSDVTLNLDTNSKTGTVKLSESPLKVIGANGIRTDLVGTNNGSLVIGLDQATVNATTKGIGLTGDTGSTGNKYLKDGDVSFAVTGDGNLVSTSATTAGVKVAVNAAKVKDLAVEAVTVSKDTQADNPITVTPTAGTNSKDYAIGIDTTKLAGKTDLTYRANNDTDANAQKVSLAKGLNFVNGDNTVATVAADGKVSYDLNVATKTKIDDSATAVARNISLGADSGTASSQSLKDGDVAFNVKGTTGDYVSTNMNGNTVEISTTRATINSDANTGAASVTGNDGLATAKNVADAINKAADAAKAGSAWNVSTNGDAGTKVSGGDTVDFTGDNNITVDRNNTNISVSLNKNLTDMNSISLVNPRGETIFLNGRDGSIQANKAEFKDNAGTSSTITSDQLKITNGLTDANEHTTAITLGTISLKSGNNSSALDSKNLSFSDEDGNNAEGNAKGFTFQSAAGKQVEFGVDEIKAGGNKIQEVAEGTADTDAVNVKQLKDTVASQTLTYRANTAADADAKSVKLSKGLDFVDGTSTIATVDNDGKVSFDLNTATKTKIDDSATAVARNISLGADSGTASSQSLKDSDVAFNVKGATGDYVSTNMNGNTVEISTTRATINSDANTGAASVTGNDGLATAKNVADAINKAADAAKAGAAWNLTTNSSATDKTSVQGGDTVDLINGDNIVITQDGTDKKKITVATKKDITVDSVTAGNTVINTSGLTNGTTAITGSGITTDKVTVGGISIDKTDGINAGGKAISNVASGGTTDTNAANIGDVKQAVANLSQNLNITDGTNNGTVDLKNQKLNVAGANGVTATVNNQTITVGLDANTVNATTKGIGLTADTGSTGNKYLKDGDVSFVVTGDGNLVSTSATAAGVKVAVDAAKVKDLAVDAVTVSKDAQADNPITVTPTAGTNSKDYAIGIDTTKLAAKTDLTYRANNDTDANAKKVSLAKGLNFVNGTLTTASIDNDGVVKYDVNTAAITAGTDGTVTGPTTDGVATAQNVADAINAAKKASKTEITANTGEAANATTGNVTLTSTTAADGHTIYDVKLNDKVTLGTGTNAVTIDGTTGKITAKNAAIGGVTLDGDNSHVTGLSNTTWNGTATTGRAATEDQLKAVADTAKATTDAVNLKFSGDTNTSAGVVNLKDDTFNIVGDGKYVTTDANGKDLTVKVSEAEVKKSAVAAVTVSTDTTDANNPISVTPTTSADGTTKDYKVTIDGTKIANKTNLSYKANDGTAKQVSLADGLNFKNGTLTTASIDDAGVVKYDVNTAAITAGTDGTVTGPTTDGVATAQNVADAINAAKKAAKTEITANTGEAANATTGNVTLTSTTATDGHTIYDVKLNDKVTLGTGANAVTIDGTAGTVTGLTNKDWTPGVTKAVTGRAATEDQLQKVADAASSQTWNITADKAGTTGAQTGTKKNATVGKDQTVELVAGDNLTINQDERKFTYSLNKDLAGLTSVSVGDGTTETIKLDGATGKVTAKNAVIGGVTVDGDNSHVTGLSNTTWNGTATTGRAATEDQLKAVSDTAKATTDAVNLKFSGDTNTSAGVVNLKDDTFNIVGDGKYVTTDANGKDLTVKVSEAEVKKSAVSAVTVSTDTTDANNPISVTPTTSADGTTKDYKVTIDGTKIANKTNLSYKANDGTAKQVSLADGLNFKNGTLTTAFIDDAGVVKYDVNTATITAGTDGTVTGPTTDGVATAQNVADAINAAKKAAKTEITANTGEVANATTGNMTLTSTTAADGHTIYDVKLNDKVTLGTGANAVTIDGTAGKATVGTAVVDGVNNTITTGGANAVSLDGAAGKATIGSSVVDGVNNTITTGGANAVSLDGAAGTVTGLTNKDWTPGVTKAVTGRAATEDQLQKVADAASSQTWNITADKAGTTGAQTGTKKNATVGKDQTVELVAGDNLTINQDERKFTYSLNKDLAGLTSVSVGDGTTETIKLDGATGKITAKNAAIGGVTVDGDNSHVTGLSNTTWNGTATTGRAATEDQLKAVSDTAKATTDAVNLKFSGDTNTSAGVVNLKDDTFNIVGDGKYVTTDANGKDLTVKVSEAEVKKSAVAAVTVSTDTTDANNPISVTPTTSADGTTKDYKVTIDGTKIANKTNLSYKANDGTAKQVSLADGLNFKNGTLTTASIDDAGVVKYDVNTAAITAGTDGTVTGPTTDGVATAQNVADAINAAKKAAKTEITANTGEAANATTGNVTLTSITAADGHTIYDVKLNDKVTLGTGANAVTIDGTAGKATIGSSVVDGVNNTFTTGGANAVALDGAAGTVKTGTVTVSGGTTNDITGLSNTTVNSADFATKGRAATEEQLKAVGEQTWQITADKDAATSGAQTGTKKDAKVGKDDKVQLIAGENLTVNQNERDFTYSLNKDLVKMNSATFEATGGKTTVITGDSIAQTDGTKTNTSTAAGNTVADGGKSTATTADGTTVTNGADSTATTAAGTTVTNANGNTKYAADGVRINTTGKDPVSLTDAGLDNGNNVIKNVASGHVNNDDTDNTNAANIADVKKATTTVTANNGEAANATTGNVTLTSTTAADGHTIYDVKLNDKVALGTGANAVTIDGTAGKATIGSSVVDGVNNTFTTGGANAVKLDGAAGTVKTGAVTVTGGTTNDITGLSNTTVNSADFATKGRAATEEQLKQVGEQTWQITADKDATTSGNQTGTKKDAKVGKDDKVQLIAGENLTVNQNERDFTYSLNKDLVKMNSATFEATGGKTTVITGDSIAQTDGTKTNRSTAAGNTVADGTKSTETTAAGQVIKDGAKTNTSTVDENTLVDGVKSNKTTVDSNVIDDGNGNVNTSNATSNTITDGTNTSTITAGKAQIGTVGIDGVTSKITTGGANAVVLNGADGTVKTGTVTLTGGTTNDITGLSNTTVTAADFATKGRAATEEQLKAVGEQTWQITADKDATTSGNQTGTKKDAKVGKDDKVQLIAGENLTVNQNERDFTYSLNKDLVKMNSATFEATGGKTTVITGDSIAQTDGTKTNTSTAAGNTVADGGKSTATTADGTTVTNGADSTATTAAGTTVTNANGNTKYAADGVRINTTGKDPVSLTDAGLDNGNNVIKNVASGHVNNDDTDNTNAANIADVKKATTTVTANNGEAANATTGNVTLTSTTAADGHTIYDVKLNDKVTLGTGTNAVTIDGTAGKATIGSSVVDGVNNTITTGGANAVALDGAAGTVKTGAVTVTGGTTNDITGLSNTTVNSADFATKGRAATEEQLKAVGEQTWQITADKDATTSGNQTGTKKDAKVGKDDKVQLIAGENLTVNQNERDFTYSLNKDLVKMNSATFEATGGKTTVITGDSIAQTDGTKTNRSTAAGNTVADGTKSTETTAAGQVIKDGAKSNKTTVDSNVIDDGNGNVNTSNATSNTITDGTNTSAITAGKAQIGTVGIDGITSKVTTGGANAVALDGAAGTVKTGSVTVTGGTTNDITGLSNTTVTTADFATKGRAATEEQLKQVGEQTWQITADKDATTSGNQTGTKKDAKVGKDDKVQLIAGENLTVNQNERDFTYSLNKDLVKMNSATFEATGGKTTVITGDSIAQTDGTKTNTSTAAGNTVADGGKSTATTADGTTVTNGADSTATTAAGTTVTNANGNTKYAADGVRINTTGKDPVSLTDAGLDNGNNVIKNVASGHVNNDDTDNTNAANIADVKKATTTVTANNGEAANATTGNVTLTSTTAADGHTIYDVKLNDKVTLGTGTNAVTIDGTAGKATIGSSVVDGVNNTITTGGANAVALEGAAGTVKTGAVTVTGGTTNDITGLSNTTVNSADFATKGRAATEEQLKAVGEQTWQITADKDATTSGNQTGTKKDAKVGKDDKVQLIAGENLTVNQNERDFTYSLNKDLVKMNSATFEATGGKTTVITGDSIAQTDGTKTNTSTAAGNTVADGGKSTATTADGTTVTSGADSTATTAAGTIVTNANGNTKYAADGVRINTTGKAPVSLTDAGLDNGNNVIKNVASGHVNNDDKDNTNAANIADVKKATTTVTANNGEGANATTGNVTLTSTTATDGHTIYDVKLNDKVTLGTGANAVTIDGTAGKATIGSSVVDGVNNTITTGGANAVSLEGAAGTVKTGTVTVTGGTTNDITGLSNTTVNSADFATKGRAATEEQLKQVGEQTWQITADKDATTSGNQTGTKKDAKVGKDDKVQLIAGENLTVNQNERDFTYSLNKDLVKMNSATFEATGGKTTVITGDSIAQTDGTKTNRSTAAGNTVADGTKSTETTAAGQVIKDGAKTNTSTVDENTLVDGAKSNKTTVDSNVIDDGNGNVNTSNATSNTITDGTNTSTITAGKATIGSSIIDGVNNTFTTGGANAVKLDGAAGTVKTGTVTVTGGTTNDITGLSNTTVNSADFATKGRAATEEQLKQVGEQTWQITADKDAATSGAQTGTKKDAKVGKDDKVQLIAGENLTVNQNERDFTYSLNKDLVKMNSATFEATGGKTTVITGDSIAQTDGTKTNRSTAAGNTVADGTKSTETTAAGQVIKDGAKTNTSTVDENTLVDGAKSNKTTVDSNVIDDGNGNVNTSKATSNTITDGTNTTEATASTVTVKDNAGNSTVITKDTITTGTGANKVTVDGTAGKVTAGSAVIDGVNNIITTGGANTVKLDGAAGTVTGLTNTAWTPGVTKAVSGRAATEDQLQQVSDAVGAGWNINSGTVAGSTGEANGSAKTKISSGEEVQLQAGNNLIIDQNGKTLAYSLNKNLKDMESAIFNATGGKTTVIKGDSIVQTDGGKTNTSNAAGNTVVDGTKSTATTAAGTTITDGAKTNTNTADKNVIDDGAGNTNTSNATSNTIADPNGNTNTATATSNTLADNAGNSNVSNATSNNLTDNAGNSNISNATSNILKNAAGDETKVDAKGATVKDAAGNTTNVASTGATVTNAAGDTTKVEATGTTVADAAGNKATFTKDGVTITKPGKDTVSLTGNGLDNGNNKIVNVADGTNDTDAVNVRQLDAKTKAATTELTANGGESADNTTGNIVLTKTTAPDGHIVYDNKLNDKITLGAADPTKAITVDGTNGTIKAGKDGNAVAINGTDGTIKAGDGTNAVAIDGVNGSVKVADKIALNGKDGKAAIGTVGIDGKDGIITTGGNNPVAVNGKDGVLTGLTNKTWDPNNITSGRAATEDQVQSAVANAGWDATVGTEGSGVNSTPSATPEKIRPNETLTFKAGNNMMVSHAGKTISYAVNPELTEMKSATFKDAAGNTTVTNGNGMTITPGSANPNNPNAGPVSLTKDGLNNGNNQIKGVAPGSDDTDAVNIGQLKASNAKIGDAIGQVAGEVQRVGAHAAAMAALKPIQYDPLEPTQVMAGVGNYRGETAAALGLAHYTNENTMFNVGVSVGGNHNMVNAGVTHKFGYSPEKKNIPDRYKAGPISSVYVMQDEVSSLKKENAEQKYVIADQAARLNTLEAENERQRQELAETKQGLDDLRAAVDRLLASKN